MSARLYCPGGRFEGRRIDFASEVTIGRRGCDLEIDDASISSRHARIYLDTATGSWMLEDLGSRNGTSLAGVRLGAPERLGRLDVINFAGICDFIFQSLEGESALRTPGEGPRPEPSTIMSSGGVPGEADDRTIYDPTFPRIPDRARDEKS